MRKLFLALLLSIVSFGVQAKEYAHDATPTVVYVFTDIPCDTVDNPDNVPLVKAYALDLAHANRADGCALEFIDKEGRKLVEFQLYVIEKDVKGVDVTKHIHTFFFRHLFNERESI